MEYQRNGNTATIDYGDAVCGIRVYQRDIITGCLSDPVIYSVDVFILEPLHIAPLLNICEGETVNLSAAQQDGVLYHWTVAHTEAASVLGDDRISDVSIVVNSLSGVPTPYSIMATLKREYCGTEAYDDIILTVNSAETATVTEPQNICQNTPVAFTANGIGGILDGGSCQWSFDGGVAVAGNPGEATFATSGQHHYTLEYTQSGCSPVTVEGTIFVNPVPDAAITPSIINQKLHFGISQEIGVSYSWEKNGAVLPYETNSIINVQDRGYGVYCCTVTCNETGCAIENCMAYNYVEQSFCIPVPVSLTESGCNEYILAVESGMEYANLEWSILPNYAGNTITSISDASAVAAAFENPGNFYIYTEATVNDICYKSKTAVDIDYVLKLDINLDCPNILNVHDNSAYRAGFTIPSRTVVLKNTDADTVVSTQTLSNTENIATFTVPEVSVPVSYTAYMTLGNCTVAKEFIQYPLPTITPVYVPDVYCAKTPLKLEIAGTDISRVVWDFGDGASLNSGTYVYHTYNEGYYTLNITAYNFKGCSESYTKDIDIRENKPSGFIKTFEKTCMGIPQLIEWESTESSFFNNIYSWSTPPVNSGYQHLVYHSDYYIVTVTDDIGCVCQDMANVPFYHTPVAKIVGETSYCSGETVALSGNSGESGVTYRWVITPPDSNSYEETTPDIEIIPSAAGLYNISLTVSNVDCSSTAETEVEVFGLSPAPVLVPVGDPCVGNPPVCIMSADGRELYWSNGYYGSTACFYNEGFITARYIDENGCYSEYGKYLICPKPNFDALLTGCYDRCESKYRLGIYNLMPSTNYGNCPQSTYQWFGDGNLLQTGNFEDSVQSFSVAVPGEHYMEVYYGDDCVATSPALTINKDEKCCKYEYKILENHCFMENGNLYYIIEIEICNTGSEDLFLYNLFVNENDGYSIRYWTVSQQDLRPGQCTRLKIILDASFVSSPAFFTFINFRNNCYVDFSVQPDLEDCMCKNEVTIFNTNCLMENGKLFFEIEVRICNTGTIPLDYYLLNVNNGYTIHNNLTPLYLEPGECKIFYIMAEVNDLSLYAAMFTLYAKNTKCVAAFSVPLLPDSKECACNTDADVEVNGFYCYAKDCKLYVNTYLKICNTGTTSLNMHNLNVIGGYVTNWSVSNSYLQPGECVYLSADIEINDFSMSSLSFVLSDGKQECLVFSLPLDLKECTGIKDDCKFENINFSFKQDLSTWQTLYFDFELVLPAGTTDLPGIWVEPSITVDYNYNPTQYVKGTFVFYYGSLKELVAEGKSICIYALVCIENKYLCLAKICIPAKDFYDQTQKPEPHIMLPEKENNISTGSISVSPNPAKDELFILNSGQFTVTGVEILDSAGKTITGIQSKNITSVDVSALPQGVYLIKIYTEKGTTVEKFNKK
jgi:hypothetical protein